MKTRFKSGKVCMLWLIGFTLILCMNNPVVAQTCNKKTDKTKKSKVEFIKETAVKGDLDLIKKLIEVKGVDVNILLPGNHTMLMYSAWNGHEEQALYLLEKGADVSVVNKGNNTAFHDAVIKGHLNIAKAIHKKGVNINQKGQWGFPPLHLACQKQRVELVDFLIEQGANVHESDKEGRPAIMINSWNGNAKITKLLVDNGADVNFETKWKNTVMHNMARGGHLEASKLLIENKVDVNSLDEDNNLPIHLAAKNQHPKMVAMLAWKTKDINTKEKHNGNSPLHIAAINGDVATAKVLMKAGANANLANDANKTPVDFSVEYAHLSLLKFYMQEKVANQKDLELAMIKKNAINLPVTLGDARLVYSGHSGWIIQTADKVLVFDYWANNKPKEACLANGSFCPKEMKDKEVYVFVSHAHGDHYDTTIHAWANDVKKIKYIYGFNPNDAWVNKKKGYNGPEYTYIANNQTMEIKGVEVTTIKSNDTGQGFLVKADGVSIYHPGDHAWFAAEDETDYKKEVDFISSINNNVDIVFQPVSGCPSRWQKEFIVKGFNYSLDKLNPQKVFPMHAFNREHTLKEFADLAKNKSIQIVCSVYIGDNFEVGALPTAKK